MGHAELLPVPLGDVINERYRLDLVLGEGGMGVVVAASRLADGLPVAIKFVKPTNDGGRSLQRLIREGHSARQLQSPFVVKILELGATGDGQPFVVMERLHGESFATALARGPFAPGLACQLMSQVCSGLQAAHELGLVHRDITPSNLFLCRSAEGIQAKILDFGLAKSLFQEQGVDATSRGWLVGSPPYMSPEQIRQGQTDARSDIWSVGIVLQQLLTNQLPFEGVSAADTFIAILTAQPQPVPAQLPLPDGLRALLAQCLRKDPAERFQNAAALGAALASLSEGGPAQSESVDDETQEFTGPGKPWRA